MKKERKAEDPQIYPETGVTAVAGSRAVLPWQHVSLHNNSCDTEWFWPTAQHRPPSPPLFISPCPSHSAELTLIFHVDWQKHRGPGERWSPGIGRGGCVPAHQMDYIRFFWENKGEKSHGSLMEFQIPHAKTICSQTHSSMVPDGWANRNMTPCLFPRVLWWLRNISPCLISAMPRERDCYHICIFTNPMQMSRVILQMYLIWS